MLLVPAAHVGARGAHVPVVGDAPQGRASLQARRHIPHPRPGATRAAQHAAPRAVAASSAAAPTATSVQAGSTGKSSAAAKSSARLLALVPWAVKNGIRFSKIKPFEGEDPDDRGLLATADIRPSESLISVPLSACIRVHPGCPPALWLPPSLWQGLHWSAQLALTLLGEVAQGRASRFADYLALLPSHVDLPACWPEADLAQLRCRYFIDQVLQQQQEWDDLQRQVGPHLETAGLMPQQLQWALAVSRSRAFAAPYVSSPLGQLGLQLPFGRRQGGPAGEPQQQQHVLTPLLDLFNHRGDVTSECEYVPDLRAPAFRVVATNAWQQGQQVFISYGSSSNDALLQLYGFCEPGSPNDRYVVTCLPVVLQQQGLTPPPTDTLNEVVCTQQGVPADAAAALAVAAGDAAAAQRCGGATTTIMGHADLPGSVRALLAAGVAAELEALGVDAEADAQLLRMFEQLPEQEAALARKRGELDQVRQRLGQLQAVAVQAAEQAGGAAERQPAQPVQQQPEQQPSQLAQQESDGAASSSSSSSELAGLIASCQQLCGQLQEEVDSLAQLTAEWGQRLPQHRRVAVQFRLAKHGLLCAVQSQLAQT